MRKNAGLSYPRSAHKAARNPSVSKRTQPRIANGSAGKLLSSMAKAPHQTDIGFIGFGNVDAKLADSLLRDGVDYDGVIACQLSPPVRAAMLKPQWLCGNLCVIWMKKPMPHVGAE